MLFARLTLALAVVLSIGSPVLAAPSTQPAAKPGGRTRSSLEPFTAIAMNFPGTLPHLKPMYPVAIANAVSTNPGIAAKEIMRSAAGLRVILATDVATGILNHPDDVCQTAAGQPTPFQGIWPTAGPRVASQRWDAWLAQFAAAGGSVDLVVLSAEDDFAIWTMPEERLAAITADPRFATVAKALGFDDARLAMQHRATKANEPARWNALMSGVVAAARRKAVFEPLRKHFPAASMCNFNDVRIDEQHTAMGVQGQAWYTIGDVAGSHQSPVLFGGATPRQIEEDWSRPYLQMIYAVNFVRCLSRSSDTPQMPWVPFKGLVTGGGKGAGFGGGDMYEEAVAHILLSGGTDNLFYYNPPVPRDIPPGAKVPRFATPADAEALNVLLADLRRQAGGKRIVAPVAVDPVRYDAKFVVSAARLEDGSTLCRITFAEREGVAQIRVGAEVVKVDRPIGRMGVWMRIP